MSHRFFRNVADDSCLFLVDIGVGSAKDYCERPAAVNLLVPFVPSQYGRRFVIVNGGAPLCRMHANRVGEKITDQIEGRRGGACKKKGRPQL